MLRSRIMTPKMDTAVQVQSYAGAGVSIIAGLTLTEWGIIVGIVTAVLTLLINWAYQHRKDRREQKLWQEQMDRIKARSESGRARLAAIIAAGVLGCAAALIIPWEGEEREAYTDIAGVPTICFGHTATARPGMVATAQQCQDLLKADMLAHLAGIERCIGAELEPHQWVALLSWAFNVGTGAACGSTLVRMINAGRPPEEWCHQLERWVYAGNKRVQGLANRRQAELAVCLGSA